MKRKVLRGFKGTLFFVCKGERGLKKINSEVRVFRISCTYINKMFFIVRSERFT